MARGLIRRATHAVRYFLLRRLPACKQISVLVSQSMERPLSLRERVRLRLHLWICIWCVWYLEHLQLLRAALREQAAEDGGATAAPLPPAARERIKRALKSEA